MDDDYLRLCHIAVILVFYIRAVLMMQKLLRLLQGLRLKRTIVKDNLAAAIEIAFETFSVNVLFSIVANQSRLLAYIIFYFVVVDGSSCVVGCIYRFYVSIATALVFYLFVLSLVPVSWS